MSAIKTIKDCARLAGITVRTTGWALGTVIRNAVLRAKNPQRSEPTKEKWVLGHEGIYGVIVGFIGTRWDNAPTVAIATTYFEMSVSEIEAISQKTAAAGVSYQTIASWIAEALRANLHVEDLGQFSCYVASFLGSKKLFAEGIAKREEGFLVSLKLKDNRLRLSVSYRGSPYDVLLALNHVDNIRGDCGHDHIPEELMFAFGFHPEDGSITGKVEVHEGIATQGGQPITLTRAGWLETSEFTACPEKFPLPRRPKVTRYPASILD